MSPLYVILALVLLTFVVGLVLLLRGLWGRRVDRAPHCRKCGYNLTGLTSNRCPECGAELTPQMIVHGTRRRRVHSLVVGASLLVVGAVFLGTWAYARAQQVNWYPRAPFFWVLADARRDVDAALRELQRRCTGRTLSSSQTRGLADAVLEMLEQQRRPQGRQAWVDLMPLLHQGGHLTSPQVERFVRQLLQVSFEIRPTVRQGEPLVAVVRGHTDPLVSYPIIVQHQHGTIRFAGEVVSENMAVSKDLAAPISGADAGLSGYRDLDYDAWHTVIFSRPDVPPGRYPFEFSVQQEVFWKGAGGLRSGPPFWSDRLVLQEEVEVLAADAPDPVRLVNTAGLKELLQRRVCPHSTFLSHGTAGHPAELRTVWCLDPPIPVGIAARVYLRLDHREFLLGSVAWPKLDQTHGSVVDRVASAWNHPEVGLDGREVHFVLRPDRELARRTAGLAEIFGGELEIGPVKVYSSSVPAPLVFRSGHRGQ